MRSTPPPIDLADVHLIASVLAYRCTDEWLYSFDDTECVVTSAFARFLLKLVWDGVWTNTHEVEARRVAADIRYSLRTVQRYLHMIDRISTAHYLATDEQKRAYARAA